MTGQEIKAKIDANNKAIEGLMNPHQFTLNKGIQKLLEENVRLQRECPHSFNNGYCIYCQRKED